MLFFLTSQKQLHFLGTGRSISRTSTHGGSGGHLSGQRRVQVSEKATGDLLVFIFMKIRLKLSHLKVKVKVFLPLSVSFYVIKCSS